MPRLQHLICLTFAVVAGQLQAGEAVNTKESYLKYRLAYRIADEVTCWGCNVELMHGKIPHLKKPQLLTGKPLYGSFRAGAEKKSYQLALVKTSNDSETYDALYFDSDGDGVFSRNEKNSPLPGGKGISFGPIRIHVNYGDETVTQNFVFVYSTVSVQDRNDPCRTELGHRLRAVNSGYYLGNVSFGKSKRLIAVVDVDGNGRYNDLIGENSTGDLLLIDENKDGRLNGTVRGSEEQPLGRWVQVDGQWWRLDVAADGSSVKVTPLNKPLGVLRGGVKTFTLLLRHDEGVVRVRTKDGRIAVPAGNYRLLQCDYELAGDSGQSWRFSADSTPANCQVIVPAKGATSLSFGPPFVPRMKITALAPRHVAINLELSGRGGEIYRRVQTAKSQRPPVPKARIVAGGRELKRLDFHYG